MKNFLILLLLIVGCTEYDPCTRDVFSCDEDLVVEYKSCHESGGLTYYWTAKGETFDSFFEMYDFFCGE